MVEVKKEPPAPPVGFLEVVITSPEMTGRNVWPRFCFLEAYLGGEPVGSEMLPIARESEKQEEADRESWRLARRIPVGPDWPGLSLDLLVERVDYVPWRRDLQLIRGGAHTSRYEAVLGRARLPLVDALLVGDPDEDEEGEDRRKRRREQAAARRPRMEGTLAFYKTVTLHDWVLPALWPPAADLVARPVRRGTVNVRMAMFEAGSR